MISQMGAVPAASNVRRAKLEMNRRRLLILGPSIVLVLTGGLALELVWTQPARQAMRTCAELFTIANRPALSDQERLSAARALCTSRYLQEHPLTLATEGISGLPRSINKNFKAWREGPNVWICTGNRIGPVYQFVYEQGRWRFDGLVAYLRPWGEIKRASELSEPP
jgi:hypothetical protein